MAKYFPAINWTHWQQCANCSKFFCLLARDKPQRLNSITPSGWDSPPLVDCDNLSTQLLTSVENDLDIAAFQFNMTDDEISDFIADSTTDGGVQSRQEDGPTIL